MSSIEIVSKFIPLALGIIMFGLGLTLTTQNFLYYRSNPKPVVIGTLAQMLLGPIFGFVLVYLFQLPPIFAVGIMLLAASPGGTTSGIITHLARGDVALSITLTAINSLIGTFSLPFIVYLSFNHFLGSEQIIPPPVIKIIQLMVVVLVPMAIGMFVNSRSPQFSKKAEPFIRK